VKVQFNGKGFAIDDERWAQVTGRLSQTNPGFRSSLRAIPRRAAEQRPAESGISKLLANDIGMLRSHGYDLRLIEREFVCHSLGGRIDLLCEWADGSGYVVIELKAERASSAAVGQTLAYVHWVGQNLPRRQRVPQGLVISLGVDEKFRYAATASQRIASVHIRDILPLWSLFVSQ
jgi:hypothetical protein